MSSLLTILRRESLVEIFIIIIKQYFFINIKYILFLGSKRVTCRIDAARICLIAKLFREHDDIISQITILDVCGEDDADALLRARDMHEGRAIHQLLMGLQILEDLLRVLHVVDVEHHQSVQMTVSQSAMTEHTALARRRRIKLTAGEDESHLIILQFLGKCQQLLGIRLFGPCLFGSLLLRFLLFQQELLIVLILQPLADDLRIMSFHSLQDLPSAINLPGSTTLPDLFPELFLCARKSLGKMSVFLEYNHRLQRLIKLRP